MLVGREGGLAVGKKRREESLLAGTECSSISVLQPVYYPRSVAPLWMRPGLADQRVKNPQLRFLYLYSFETWLQIRGMGNGDHYPPSSFLL